MPFDDLYQEIILDHSRHPHNKENLDFIPEDQIFENPTCGDSVKVAVDTENGSTVSKVRFDGEGCAISTASASMMSEMLAGKTIIEALKISQTFIDIMVSKSGSTLEDWGELESLEGVRKFPQRVKCATLPWHAVEHSLEKLLKDVK